MWGIISVMLVGVLQAQPACVNDQCCCGDPVEVGVPCGDFEAPPFANPIIVFNTGEMYCDWTIVSGSVDLLGANYSNWAQGNPNGPSQYIDLHGNTVGTIATTLNGLNPGQQYILTLYYAKNAGASSANCRVTVAGGAWLDSTFTATNNGADGWLLKCYRFTAQAATAELRFAGSGGNPNQGVLLDDISLWYCPTDSEDPVVQNPPVPVIDHPCFLPVPVPDDLIVTDNCPGDIMINFAEVNIPQSCYYDLERTWTITDGCGNTITLEQRILVRDESPPVFVVPPTDYVEPCGPGYLDAFYNWVNSNGLGYAVDDCDPDVNWLADYISVPDGNCGQTTVRFVVTDECGNSAEATATFFIADNVPPDIVLPAQDKYVYCVSNALDSFQVWLADNGGAYAIDPCESVTWAYGINGNLSDPVVEVIFSATDGCGNEAQTTALFVQINDSDTIRLNQTTCNPLQAGSDTIIIQQGACLSVTINIVSLLASDTIRLSDYSCDPALAGMDTLFLQNFNGCDSLVITQTFTWPKDTTTITVWTCDPGGATKDTFYLANQYGCDSIVYAETIFSGVYVGYVDEVRCQAGVDFLDTVIVTGGPCDSLFITKVLFHKPDTLLVQSSTCDPAQAGAFTTVYPDVFGCDSSVITQIILLPTDYVAEQVAVCHLQDVGIDTLIVPNQWGCDSIVITNRYYAGVDTIFSTSYSCDTLQTGIVTTIHPGLYCDTVKMHSTLWVPSILTSATVFSCEGSGVAADTTWAINSAGCDSLHVTKYHYSDLTMKVNVGGESCAGWKDGRIVGQVTGGTPPIYYQVNGGTWQISSEFTGLMPGVYSLVVRDDQGCTRSVHGVTVDAGLSIEFDAGPDREVALGDIIQLDAPSPLAPYNLQWFAEDPLSCPQCLKTNLGPISKDQNVMLRVWTTAGCEAEDGLRVILKQIVTRPVVYIPNSFSPNYDGINDVFSIYGNEFVAAVNLLQIFDRWGNALFSIADLPINEPGIGWDGTYREKPMDPGVYVYTAEVRMTDGSIRLYKGDIILIR